MAEPLISFEGWCATGVCSIAQMGQRGGHKVSASKCRRLDRGASHFDTAVSFAHDRLVVQYESAYPKSNAAGYCLTVGVNSQNRPRFAVAKEISTGLLGQ